MNIISIDIGSYSVKFIEAISERKSLVLQSVHEVLISEAIAHLGDETTTEEAQLAIIQSFLSEVKYQARVIFQIPTQHTTQRFFKLPTSNKKKAELMIPFQLEEEVPYKAGESHFAIILAKKSDHTIALTSIVKRTTFDDFYTKLQERKIVPNCLTSEISLIQRYVENSPFEEPVCILDMGHLLTKAYFVIYDRVVSVHTSSVAGQLINQVLSESYNISMEETITYKHRNAFFLTDEQLDSVDEDQKDFSLFMKKILSPLIVDLKKWSLGFRVSQGKSVSKILVFGGTSNIKNTRTFLAYMTGYVCEYFNPYELINFGIINLARQQKNSFAIGHMAAGNLGKKKSPLNFLTGKYSSDSVEDLPLHTASFVGVRSIILAFILFLTLYVDRFYLKKIDKKITNKTVKLLKDPSLGLSAKDKQRRKLVKKPDQVLRRINQQFSLLEQEVQTLQSSVQINAISPLEALSRALKVDKKTILESFESHNGEAKAVFTSPAIRKLKEILIALKLKDAQIEEKKNKLNLIFRY